MKSSQELTFFQRKTATIAEPKWIVYLSICSGERGKLMTDGHNVCTYAHPKLVWIDIKDMPPAAVHANDVADINLNSKRVCIHTHSYRSATFHAYKHTCCMYGSAGWWARGTAQILISAVFRTNRFYCAANSSRNVYILYNARRWNWSAYASVCVCDVCVFVHVKCLFNENARNKDECIYFEF